jgi:hypothetical protein
MEKGDPDEHHTHIADGRNNLKGEAGGALDEEVRDEVHAHTQCTSHDQQRRQLLQF